MKNILFLLFLVSFSLVYSQNENSQEYPPPTEGPRRIQSVDTVEKMPLFPGGINSLRKKIAENIKVKKVEGSGTVKTVLIFDIDTEGKMTNFKTSGSNKSFNEQAVIALEKIKNKWIPAERDGKRVKYTYRIPLALVFE